VDPGQRRKKKLRAIFHQLSYEEEKTLLDE